MDGRSFEAVGTDAGLEPAATDSEFERLDVEVGRALAVAAWPPAVDLEPAVLSAVRPAVRRRRLLGAVPVGLSLGVTAAGAGMLGGVPGGGVVSMLPGWSSAAVVHLLACLEGWRIALSSAAGLEFAIGVQLAATAVTVLAATATGALARQWRRVAAWPAAR